MVTESKFIQAGGNGDLNVTLFKKRKKKSGILFVS